MRINENYYEKLKYIRSCIANKNNVESAYHRNIILYITGTIPGGCGGVLR